MISFTAISPSPLASPATHADSWALPERDVHHRDELVDGDVSAAVAVADATRGAPVGVSVGVLDGGGVSVWGGVGD